MQVAQVLGEELGRSGHAGGKEWTGQGFCKEVAEKRRISIHIGCTRKWQGEQAGRKGTGRGERKQGSTPKHVGRDLGSGRGGRGR